MVLKGLALFFGRGLLERVSRFLRDEAEVLFDENH